MVNTHLGVQYVHLQLRGRTCLPYVKGLSERLKRILEKAGVRTALKPCQTLADVFRVPKERPTVKSIVYKVKCNSCSFTYIGETKRTWETRWLEHNYSAVKVTQKLQAMK